MTISQFAAIEQCGRTFTKQEIEEIAETVKAFPKLSQTTLTETLCEHLGWFTATGRYKKDACLKLLKKNRGCRHYQPPSKTHTTKVTHSKSKK